MFGGVVEDKPPVAVFQEEWFRVCLFPDKEVTCDCCGKPCHWLVLELRGDGKWYHLVTIQESRLGVMLDVLSQVVDHLRAAAERSPVPANDSPEGEWVLVHDEKFFVHGLTLVHHADPSIRFAFSSAREMEEFLVGHC